MNMPGKITVNSRQRARLHLDCWLTQCGLFQKGRSSGKEKRRVFHR